MSSKTKLTLVAVSWIIVLSAFAFADGIIIDPTEGVRNALAQVSEEDQIAYIEVTEEEYSISLYVKLDFSDYEKEEVLWIVPFNDIPKDIELSQIEFSVFKDKFRGFDEAVERAKQAEVDYEYFPSDYMRSLFFGYLGVPFFGFFAWIGGTASTLSAEAGALVKSYDFGELGSADVYKVADGKTLEQFLRDNGIEAPEAVEKYLKSYIVAFRIKKTYAPWVYW